MRCNLSKCEYNSEGYCQSPPEYITIDNDGRCEQMWVKSYTVTEKYLEFKKVADESYKTFDNNPTQANSDNYGVALNNLRDFCIEFVDKLIAKSPHITNNIIWEEEW